MEQKTKIIIETDAGRSEQILQAVKKGMQDVDNQTSKTGKTLEKETGLMDAALARTALSFAAFTAGTKTAFDMAREGAQLADMRHNLQLTAAQAGISYEKLAKAVRSGSNGVVNDLTLLQQTHKALKLGVTRDVDDLGKLWAVSEALSGDFGQTTEQTFEQIARAISEGNGKALISMGLLPESFKRASDAGTLLQKRGELLRDVLAQTSDRVKILNDNGDTAADKFDQLDTSVKNVKLQLGEALTDVFVPTVEWLNKDLIPALQTSIDYWREWLGVLDKAQEGFKFQGKAGQLAAISTRESELNGINKEIEDSRFKGFGSMRSALAKAGVELDWDDDSDQSIKIAQNRIELELKALAVQKERIKQTVEQKQEDLEAATNAVKTIKSREAAEAEEAEKKRLAEEAEKQRKNELTEAQNRLTKAIEATEKATTEVSTAFLNGFGTKTITSLKDAQDLLTQMTAAAGGFAVGLQNGTTEAGKLYEKLKKVDEYNENWLSMLRNSGTNAASDLRGLTPDNAMAGMMNFVSGGLWSAQGKEIKNAIKETEAPLAKTIAEAVQAGFANADFSNLELTLGSIISNVISKSVSQSNPVMNAEGAINWGNLGVNLAVNAATQVLTRPGRFFGGREEHGKEAIQQAADLKSRMGQEYVDSFVSEITSVFATRAMKDAIANARLGYSGTQTGYTWNDSGNGWTSDRTRTYAMIDNGASAALKKLTDAVKAAETFSENQEAWINLQAAKGYEYSALQAKVDAYKESLTSVYFGQQDLRWSDGSVNEGQNLTVITREIESTLAEMVRELGQATADRFTAAASGFSKYAPWLDNIYMSNQYSEQSFSGNGIFSPVRGTPLPGADGYSANVGELSRDEYYDAFEKLQNDFADRKASPGLLDMVKEASDAKFELEKLRVTGSDDYAEAYLDYLKKQTSAIEEVMERQAAIFNDATRTFEEQAAALSNYEAAREAYHKAELDTLIAEQAAKEAIKQKELEAAARSRDKMASALNIYGEIAQAGTKIYVLTGGNRDIAYDELIRQNSDNPAVVSALKGAEARNQGMVLWGEK